MKKTFLATIMLAALTVPAASFATPVLTFNEGTGTSGANQDQSVGWQFDVNAPITVTGLGWFDEGANGLATSHTVGIWNPAGTLLTSAVLPSGVAAGLDGQFRTVAIAPIILLPGTGYIVGGENFFQNTERLASNVTYTLHPSLTFIDATFSPIGSGFTRPTSFSVATSGFFGPSFSVDRQVPEPSSLLLLGAGVAGAGLRRLRQKRS